MKVVYNACYGGYGLSELAEARLEELKGKSLTYAELMSIPRHDADLVEVVEELGTKADGDFADLRVDIISGNQYLIREYDGIEEVIEPKDIDWIEVTQ